MFLGMKTSSGSILTKNLLSVSRAFFSVFAKLIGKLLLSLNCSCLCFLSFLGGFFVVLKFSYSIFKAIVVHLSTEYSNCFFWGHSSTINSHLDPALVLDELSHLQYCIDYLQSLSRTC